MTRARFWALVPLLGGVLPALCAETILKEMPAEGDIPFGKVVYVDDRKCPDGEIKEVTGGSKTKGIERKVRCVKRPGAASPK